MASQPHWSWNPCGSPPAGADLHDGSLADALDSLSLRPPPLGHSAHCSCDGSDDLDEPGSPPRYRSLSSNGFEEPIYRSAAFAYSDDELLADEDDDEVSGPVYRSATLQRDLYDASQWAPAHPAAIGKATLRHFDGPSHHRSFAAASGHPNLHEMIGEGKVDSFAFELPVDIFDAVLHLLSASPGLLQAITAEMLAVLSFFPIQALAFSYTARMHVCQIFSSRCACANRGGGKYALTIFAA
mmetsp:Transcript_11084/g.28382  ORF Transcript_11084/g.28382 Transcript_11084/m.28382 type:complete len:241 (-) Transcript_11084:1718-2440(-)